jgi:hypothetical protein
MNQDDVFYLRLHPVAQNGRAFLTPFMGILV